MKPFDLERAIAGDKLITRNKHEVLEFHYFKSFNEEGGDHCCVAVIKNAGGTAYFATFNKKGRYRESHEHNYDLFMAPKLKKYWININRIPLHSHPVCQVYSSEEESSKNKTESYIETICIDLEE